MAWNVWVKQFISELKVQSTMFQLQSCAQHKMSTEERLSALEQTQDYPYQYSLGYISKSYETSLASEDGAVSSSPCPHPFCRLFPHCGVQTSLKDPSCQDSQQPTAKSCLTDRGAPPVKVKPSLTVCRKQCSVLKCISKASSYILSVLTPSLPVK